MRKRTETKDTEGYSMYKIGEFTVCLKINEEYTERVSMAYKFYDGGEIIFKGTDFCPSPMYKPYSLESAICLCGFLCLKPGDTDKSYFKNYSQVQMDWCMSNRAEELGLIVYDMEEKFRKNRRKSNAE